MGFVHLHLHTHYSLLDSTIRIPALMKRVAAQGMPAVAMTDHGNMFGAVEFFKAAKKAGVKPILGCELNVCESLQAGAGKSFLLPVLAATNEGYSNLIYLVSQGYLQGHDGERPRVDKAMLRERSRGLLAFTGNLGGEVPQAVLRRDEARAEHVLQELAEIFGRDALYVELLDNRIREQHSVNQAMVELADRFQLPLVAANDCHYLSQSDAPAHGVLMCVQMGKVLNNLEALERFIDSFYVKSPEQMQAAFADQPEAIANTLVIAERCNVDLDLSNTYLPLYKVPEGFTRESFLRRISREGLEARFGEMRGQGLAHDEGEYRERLEVELDIIEQMGFPGYFLIVWDFINYAKQNDIPVGPGRGSGAGSLVAYSLRITDINPMPYDLLFERFLNPERVSMPDFDIDFCMNKRQQVIDYVTNKYGKNNVGQIATFGSLKARGCLRDVGRTMGFSYGEIDRIAKLVPDVLNITLEQALEQEPKLPAAMREDPRVKQLVDTAMALEGLYRHPGMHAAGLVISEEPLWEYVPLFRGANGEIVTQFAKNEVEEAGLVKFDFLGLKTLTVIDQAVALINQGRPDAEPFDINAIPIDDPDVFKLLSSGNTTGVFQLESSGFKELMKKLKPDVFEDIIAAVALYRPGPLGSGMVDDFIRRKHGEIAVAYPHPWLEDVLRDTYGVIVYQEQVMKIASIMAGFSLGQADLLRRAMGKKKPEVMQQQREFFVDGALKKEVDGQIAGEIFDLMAYFAGYGFNKSHSAAYALISYQTAYLKAHYPVEFMAALLTCDKENSDKVVKFIAEAKQMSISVLPPDVNESMEDFTVSEGKIRFGLGAVKNVGASAIESMIEGRASGPYASLFDFCERVDLRKVNKRVLEQLVKCGAFDFTDEPRAQLFVSIESAIERGQKAQHDRDTGQINLFGLLAPTPAASREERPREVEMTPEWPDKELLAYEKEAIGFYITAHPLDRYGNEIKRYTTAEIATLETLANQTQVVLAGAVVGLRERRLKSGKGTMAFLQLEDKTGQVEVIVFSRVYEQFGALLTTEDALLVTGRLTFEGEPGSQEVRVRAESFNSIVEFRRQRRTTIPIRLDANRTTTRELLKLKKILKSHPGDCQVRLHLQFDAESEAVFQLCELVDPNDAWLHSLRTHFGRDAVEL
ncbi:MAG: DNA polymerase III subunit alpha [Myxococcales bacterium]|nr:DNA polymerase III subunit alpha [Myxococcales bacterium]